MTKKNDQKRLLDDVLVDEMDAGFHEALLAETLRLARRRRQFRQAQRVGVMLSLVFAITVVVVWRNPWATVNIQPPLVQNYQLTLSQPFPPASIVSTRPLSADQLVASRALALVLHTAEMSGNYQEVGDDELLALAEPQVVALVRRGPHEVDLVFIPSPVEATSNQN